MVLIGHYNKGESYTDREKKLINTFMNPVELFIRYQYGFPLICEKGFCVDLCLSDRQRYKKCRLSGDQKEIYKKMDDLYSIPKFPWFTVIGIVLFIVLLAYLFVKYFLIDKEENPDIKIMDILGEDVVLISLVIVIVVIVMVFLFYYDKMNKDSGNYDKAIKFFMENKDKWPVVGDLAPRTDIDSNYNPVTEKQWVEMGQTNELKSRSKGTNTNLLKIEEDLENQIKSKYGRPLSIAVLSLIWIYAMYFGLTLENPTIYTLIVGLSLLLLAIGIISGSNDIIPGISLVISLFVMINTHQNDALILCILSLLGLLTTRPF